MYQIAVRRRENDFPLENILQNLSKKLAMFLFAFMYASTDVQYFMAETIVPKRLYLYIPKGRREIGRPKRAWKNQFRNSEYCKAL